MFGDKNSYVDWHLVPDGRPVIALPEVKSVTVDIPGSDGILDLSESLTKYPVYSMREGDLTFHVLNGYEPWQVIHDKITKHLHGKSRMMILEDDLNYYYYGKYSVEWISNNDGTWSDVNIKYVLDPYKRYIKTSVSENPSLYKDISLNDTTVTKNLGGTGTLGSMPVVPVFTTSNIGTSGITISLVNQELGITNLSHTIGSNGSHKFYDMILSEITEPNQCRLTLSGKGKIDITFRRGEL